MERPRILPDGSYVFPDRGELPSDREGFERDPLNPWRLVPKFRACRHRGSVDKVTPCKKRIPVPVCLVQDERLISQSDCVNCKLCEE